MRRGARRRRKVMCVLGRHRVCAYSNLMDICLDCHKLVPRRW